MFIINPGTEKQQNYNQKNAVDVARLILKDLGFGGVSWYRNPKEDDDKGWYGFIFEKDSNKVKVHIPGVEAERVRKGEPFYSPRLYVDGSSWLYGYALGFIERGLKNISN